MKIISWNVNGIAAVGKKGMDGVRLVVDKKKPLPMNVLQHLLNSEMPDVMCLQETKTSTGNIGEFEKYRHMYPNIYILCSDMRKGYSGVAMLAKQKPKNVWFGFEKLTLDGADSLHKEGRIITAEFDKCVLITCYTPNSKAKLERLDERINAWEPLFRSYVKSLQDTIQKPVIIVGDLNVAPSAIDIHKPNTHTKSPGFTPEERDAFQKLLTECNLVDAFRVLQPQSTAYTYFSNFARSRERNVGWRIDLCLVPDSLKTKITSSTMLPEYFGSDHVPIMVCIDDI
jgi:exodeoxyribonuclease-3